ncbi:glycosyltransferase family 4 protein [Pseudomonas faucium]|uniref:glycosyltransferase family 4 protein n=1 Tax=Pseudomonas faucium TaxID=2740518 RepID=UPI001F2193F8|nr:glycosyltransferase family 1 protein [Pseudomonas faucium]
MSSIWLDVTTVLGWHRHAVGIVRTEAECAAYALDMVARGNDVRFCYFDKLRGYRVVDIGEVEAALSRIANPDAHSSRPAPVAETLPRASFEARLKVKVMKLIGHMPIAVKAHIYRFLLRRKESVFEGVAALRRLKHALKLFIRPPQKFVEQSPAYKLADLDIHSHPFKPGDTYLSLGLDWDQKDLVYLYSLKKISGIKVLLFCYDVIPVKLPHLCVGDVAAKFARYFSDVSWVADKVLCISECSRIDLQDLLHELGAPIPEMSVVRLGSQIVKVEEESLSSNLSFLMDKKFILFVSTIERRKNHEVLYRAYTRLIDQGIKNLPLLVFVGMQGWGVNDLISDLKLDPRTKDLIFMLNNVSDADLAILYKKSYMTAFPSVYEGWGLPVAESLAAGKFCLASSAASIPEVGHDLIEYIDPWDTLAWAERLAWYIAHPEEVIKREANIRATYMASTWHATAASVFDSARSLDTPQRLTFESEPCKVSNNH